MTNQSVQKPFQSAPSALDKLIRETTYIDFFFKNSVLMSLIRIEKRVGSKVLTRVLLFWQRGKHKCSKLADQSFIEPLELTVSAFHCNRNTLRELWGG